MCTSIYPNYCSVHSYQSQLLEQINLPSVIVDDLCLQNQVHELEADCDPMMLRFQNINLATTNQHMLTKTTQSATKSPSGTIFRDDPWLRQIKIPKFSNSTNFKSHVPSISVEDRLRQVAAKNSFKSITVSQIQENQQLSQSNHPTNNSSTSTSSTQSSVAQPFPRTNHRKH